MLGWMPILFGAVFLWAAIYSPIDEKKEVARLEAIVDEIEDQIEDGEFKYALMNADGLVYSGSITNDEQSRKWEIEREYWIDKIMEEAEKNGVKLERPKDTPKEDEADMDTKSGGFEEGIDTTKENIDEFNRIVNGEETSEENDNN